MADLYLKNSTGNDIAIDDLGFIIAAGQSIVVNSIKKIEKSHHGVKFNTYLINNKIRLKKLDIVHFKCQKCKNETSQQFRHNNKFFDNQLVCGDCIKKETLLNNYGVDSPQKSQIIQNKTKKTCMTKYGGNSPASSSVIQEKMKQTCLKRYMVERPLQNKEIKEKIRKTCIKKYGHENVLSNDSYIRIKMQKDLLDKYGVDNVQKIQKVREKTNDTIINKYGGYYFLGDPKCKWFEIDNKNVQGRFELKVAKWLTTNNVNWISHKNIKSIQYLDKNGKKRRYYPDFYDINNDIYYEPHAEYRWDDAFQFKIDQCKNAGYKIIAFNEKQFKDIERGAF